jgi:hypothetical protein
MPTSRTTRNLSKPTGRTKIPGGSLAYFRTRMRMRMFTLVRREFAKTGITKAELAERLGKGADQINHWLATPGNWTLDSLSDLLFATTGAELASEVVYPLEKSKRVVAKEVAPVEVIAAPPLMQNGLPPPAESPSIREHTIPWRQIAASDQIYGIPVDQHGIMRGLEISNADVGIPYDDQYFLNVGIPQTNEKLVESLQSLASSSPAPFMIPAGSLEQLNER